MEGGTKAHGIAQHTPQNSTIQQNSRILYELQLGSEVYLQVMWSSDGKYRQSVVNLLQFCHYLVSDLQVL